jgi:heme/copper-type cytochrome/quinol oxidase subunit 3
MSTSLEQMHEMEPHIRVARARAGVLLLILSDFLSVMAILAAGGYLNALNVSGQFRAGSHAPAFLPGLLLAIVLLLSALSYYWWERRVRRDEENAPQILFWLAWVLIIAALIGQVWIAAKLGYSAPYHAYASLIELISWFSSVHLLLTTIVGLLLSGRILHGRMVGNQYVAEVVGYWWYYTVISNLLLWLFILLLA